MKDDYMKFAPAPQDQLTTPVSKRKYCNQDPAWHEYMYSLTPVIESIAMKACSADEAMREDCVQVALWELAKHYPEDCNAYRDFMFGLMEESKCMTQLGAFCRQVARNTIFSYLQPYSTGSWTIGRSVTVKDKETGESKKIHRGPRFSSLDELQEYGMDVDESGNITWAEAKTEGLLDG